MIDAPVREDWDGTGVGIGEVLDRLAAQRRPPDGGPPFTLAGVLNLVAYAPPTADADAMQEVIEGLAGHQPSRAVLLAEGGPGEGIDAAVSTSCRLTRDHAAVAVELVRLTLRGDAVDGAASAAVPLLRPDLPTVLWWPGPPDAAGDGALDRLAAIADRVVTEAPDAPGVRALADWVAGTSAAVTDLAWARITSWRRLIAQMVEGEPLAQLRAGPATATVRHGAPEPDAGSLLMAGWLTDLVGSGLTVELSARPELPEGLLAVDLEGSATRRHLAVERIPGRPAAAVCVTEADGARRRRVLPLPDADRARLLAGELELQRRDRAFERALPGAAAMARR